MDLQTILTLIANVGFPIAMTLVLLWYIVQLNKAHKEEIGELRKSIDNNSRVIEDLARKLDK